MKIAIDTYQISFRALGSLLVMGGATLLAGSIYESSLKLAGAGGVMLLAGMWGARGHICLIMRPSTAVVRQVKHTLELMSLKYSEADNAVTLRATSTTVRARPLGPVTMLSFEYGEGGSAREKYLAKTLVKYQRYI